MKAKKTSLIMINFSLLVCGNGGCTGITRQGLSPKATGQNEAPSLPVNRLDDADVRQLISLLSSENKDERNWAQTKLLQFAEESSANREAVINQLRRSVEALNLEGKPVLDTKTFRVWSNASQLFAELRATEAIDLLIRFIYCGDGFVRGASFDYPAEAALVSMGSLAVPKLSDALLNDKDPMIRICVASCLGNIGGPEAKRSLEEALNSEVDPDVKYSIKLSLATIERERPKV